MARTLNDTHSQLIAMLKQVLTKGDGQDDALLSLTGGRVRGESTALAKSTTEMQVKTFISWCNAYLVKRDKKISDLTEFSDGLLLIHLLECVTNEKVGKYTSNPGSRIQKIENTNIALQFAKRKGAHLVGVSAEDVLDGNVKMLLGMVWAFVRTFQLLPFGQSGSQGGTSDFESHLLSWCSKTAESSDVPINNFTTSFQDGLAFATILENLCPSLMDIDAVKEIEDPKARLLHVFEAAEAQLQVPKILDPNDIVVPNQVDGKSVMLYLSMLRSAAEAKSKVEATKTKTTVEKEELESTKEKLMKEAEDREKLQKAKQALEDQLMQSQKMLDEMEGKEVTYREKILAEEQEKETLAQTTNQMEAELESLRGRLETEAAAGEKLLHKYKDELDKVSEVLEEERGARRAAELSKQHLVAELRESNKQMIAMKKMLSRVNRVEVRRDSKREEEIIQLQIDSVKSIMKQGWLAKESNRFQGQMDRRWFIMIDFEIRYYEKMGDKNPKKVISLEDKSCMLAKEPVIHPDRSFALMTAGDKKKRKFRILADTKIDADSWFEQISNKLACVQYLKKMAIAQTPPDIRVLQFFTKFAFIQLNLDGTQRPMETVTALAPLLHYHVNLQVFSMEESQLTDIEVTVLAEAVGKNTSLRTLKLGTNSIGGDGAQALAKALEENASLECLHLGFNQIDDAGAAALGKALPSHRSLRVLDLSNNMIGDEGVVAVCAGLEGREGANPDQQDDAAPHNMEKLSLSSNFLGDPAAEAIAALISKNPLVTIIDVSNNSVADNGMAALATALRSNKSVTEIDLSKNEITAVGLRTFVDTLKTNKTISHFNLGDNRFMGINPLTSLMSLFDEGLAYPEFAIRRYQLQ